MSLARQLGMAMSLLLAVALVQGAQATAAAAVPLWPVTVTVASVLACLLIWRWLYRGVVQPVQGAFDTACAVAGGDLTRQFDAGRAGDFGRLLSALQQMNVNLQAIIGDVRANVETIDIGTREISSGNLGLSERTEGHYRRVG